MISPAFAQANRTTTCSGQFAASVATRSPRASPRCEERGGEPLRGFVELRVREQRAVVVDRDAPRRRARPVAEQPADRVPAAHRRNSSRSAANRSGCSQKSRWPVPGTSSSTAPGMRAASSSAFRGSIDVVLGAVHDERRRGDPADPVERVEGRAGRRLRLPAGRIRRAREPPPVDLLDELAARRPSRSRRSAGARRPARATPPPPSGARSAPASGRSRRRPASCRRARAGRRDRDPRARPPARPCRRGSRRPRARSRSRRRRGPRRRRRPARATVYGPGGTSLSPIAAVVVRDHEEVAGEPARRRAPSPSRA